ncbi:MAG: choice-of-anchor Q domain-containing protein [Thermoanaerobaculia bacterium]
MADGLVDVAQDGQCSLIEALENANGDAIHADCTAGDDGLDTLVLTAGSIYTLIEVHNEADWPGGSNGLPSVTTPIVVQGRGATVERASDGDTPEFRLFHVGDNGELTVEDLTLLNGQVSSGAGIASVATLTVLRSVLSGNSGSGIWNDGDATISNSLLIDNSSGIYNIYSATVLNSTLNANSGNGIRCIDGTLTVINSTLSGNSGNGLGTDGCSTMVLNSTLSGNSGRGVYIDDSHPTVVNTIIAGSGVADCEVGKGGPVFNGVNLIEDNSCGCTPPSCISGDPLLGKLADNGGPTPTHALLVGSIAIDKADDADCPETDQRGVARGIDAVGDGSDDDLDGGCDIGAFEAGGFLAAALVVDPEPVISDGNGVFEPGERVVVAPAWQNALASAEALSGSASDFTGPAGPTYELVGEDAEYGEVGPAEVASCQDTGICYQMEVDLAGGDRPATHWEATFEETLSDETGKTWTLHIGDSFADVPRTSPFYRSIETLLHQGVTSGCGGNEYCPAATVNRAAMAALVLKAEEGRDYAPPHCDEGSEQFADVPFDSPFCAWIEELASRGVVAGCGGGNYCPSAPVTRAQMAVFLLRTLLGAAYDPPECAGIFEDVPCPSLFADWVEDLYARGITAGCGTDPLEYCPASSITRAQMSAFLSKTFGLTLYGP